MKLNVKTGSLLVIGSVLVISGSSAGCSGAIGPEEGTEPTSETKEALTDMACHTFLNHGGSAFEQLLPVTVLGCQLNAGFKRSSFHVWNGGAGDCQPLGWFAPSDVHDGRVLVSVKNSAGFLSGTCQADIFEESEPAVHSLCTAGGPLSAASTPCATKICAADNHCCSSGWDQACVDDVRSVCNMLTCPTQRCSHAECSTGPALANACTPSVSLVCGRDPFCCTTQWDAICVNEVASFAGMNCGP